MTKRYVGARLPEELYKLAEKRAHEQMTTISEVIRQILVKELKKRS